MVIALVGFRLKFCFVFVISHPRPRFFFCILLLLDWSPLYLKGINRGASHFATFSWALCCWTSLVCSCEWNYRHCLSPQIRNSQVSEAVSASVFIWKGKRGESPEVSVPCRDWGQFLWLSHLHWFSTFLVPSEDGGRCSLRNINF